MADAARTGLAASYDLVAEGYDRQRYVRLCAERLARLADPAPGQAVLDVATGTGWGAIAAAREVRSQGRVVGLDMSPGMLREARLKARQAGVGDIAFVEGDAERLDFADATFDVVMCASALFFLPRMAEALADWRRVLKPGGRIAFSTFGETLFQPLRGLLKARLAEYGVPFPAGGHNARLSAAEQCATLLRGAGFDDATVVVEDLDYFVADADAYWEDTIAWNGGWRSLIARVPDERFERFRAEHLAEVTAQATPEGIRIAVPCVFALGRKP